MPLVWAHAEYAKLVRSLHDGRVFDMPQQPYERYVRQRVGCDITIWAPHSRVRLMPVGNRLHIHSPRPAEIRWSVNGADACHTTSTDSTVGIWLARLDTERLAVGTKLQFAVIPAGEATWSEVHDLEVVA